MGRPALGQARKEKVVAIRITPAEEKALIEKFGSTANGLKAGLRAALHEEEE